MRPAVVGELLDGLGVATLDWSRWRWLSSTGVSSISIPEVGFPGAKTPLLCGSLRRTPVSRWLATRYAWRITSFPLVGSELLASLGVSCSAVRFAHRFACSEASLRSASLLHVGRQREAIVGRVLERVGLPVFARRERHGADAVSRGDLQCGLEICVP